MINKNSAPSASDSRRKQVTADVPFDVRHDVVSECETAYLLRSHSMKRRLLAAKDRQGGRNLKMVCAELGFGE